MAARKLATLLVVAAGTVGLLDGIASAGVTAHSDPEGKAGGLVYRSSSLQFAGAGDAVAACPKKRVLSGGGASLDGDPSMGYLGRLAPDYSSPDVSFKKGYGASGYVQGLGQDLKTYAICQRRSEAPVFRQKQDLFSMPGTAITLQSKCPRGTHVTGGGVDNGAHDDDLLISAPYDGNDGDSKPDDGWLGEVVPTHTAQITTVRAICAKGKLTYESGDETGTGNPDAGATCPTNAVVTGGGASISGGAGATLFRSQPSDVGDANTTPEDGWYGLAHTISSRTLTIYAICRKVP